MASGPLTATQVRAYRFITPALAVALLVVTAVWLITSDRDDGHEDFYVDGSYEAVTGLPADRGMNLTIRRQTGRFEVRSVAGELLAAGEWSYSMYNTIRFRSSICPKPDLPGEYLIRTSFPPDHPQELSLLNINDTCEALSRLLTVKTWERAGVDAPRSDTTPGRLLERVSGAARAGPFAGD